MKRGFCILLVFFGIATTAHAQTVSLSTVSAKGIAVYGWKNGTPTVLYAKKQGYLFPIASITKLVTAKAVEQLYPQAALFTLSDTAMQTLGNSNGLAPGMVLSRDDLLRALLISSNNAAGTQFAEAAGTSVFIKTMNDFLHLHQYTKTVFTNPTGLDPDNKKISPNRLTPKSLSYLISTIYTNDPLLTGILEQKSAIVTDHHSNSTIEMRSSDELNYNPLYDSYVILGKTGKTNLAGQDLVFVTNGANKYDYVTVVLLHSKDRYKDGKLMLDWLQQVLHYTPYASH